MNNEKEHVILEVKNLKKYFPIKKGFLKKTVNYVRAVDNLNFKIKKGETLSLVGESGCGKTTTARCIIRALTPTDGKVFLQTERGKIVNIADLYRKGLQNYRKNMQLIFQDPFSSLNPRMTLFDIVGEPLLVHGMGERKQRIDKVQELLDLVGLSPEYMRRYPHAFSGGQRQRIGIARALALNPDLIIADEPVSALDVSVQAQILNLLLDLQQNLSLTYLFIAHDLSVVKHVSDKVAVMYVGKIVEKAETEELYKYPKHPYTEALLSAVPVADPQFSSTEEILEGEVADPADPPSGCYFHPRCPYSIDKCSLQPPDFIEISADHYVSCHRVEELSLKGIGEQK